MLQVSNPTIISYTHGSIKYIRVSQYYSRHWLLRLHGIFLRLLGSWYYNLLFTYKLIFQFFKIKNAKVINIKIINSFKIVNK